MSHDESTANLQRRIREFLDAPRPSGLFHVEPSATNELLSEFAHTGGISGKPDTGVVLDLSIAANLNAADESRSDEERRYFTTSAQLLSEIRNLPSVSDRQPSEPPKGQTSSRTRPQITARLSLIRFGTYALLSIAALFAVRMYYVIPVQRQYTWKYHHGGLAPSEAPGFADTHLSGGEISARALDCARQNGIDPSGLLRMNIDLGERGGRLVWVVRWGIVAKISPPFRVVIDDASGRAVLEHLPWPMPAIQVGYLPSVME